MNKLPKARIENIVIQKLNNELLIYDLISNRALCLNETSKIVWQACDDKTTFAEFRSKNNSQFSDELIWLTLDQLKADNLLDKRVEIEPKFNGLTRRQVIIKVGFTTMIALPLIVSIVAPISTVAQSICQPFTCQANYPNQCGNLSNNCGGQVTCSCPGIRSCSVTNCLCPDPDTAAILPSVAPFCVSRCNQQIFIGSNAQGDLVLGGDFSCLVNCSDCGGGNP